MERIDITAEKLNCSKLEVARRYWQEQGCKLLADIYPGAIIPMKYICSCGHEGNTSWNNFTNGKRCGHCVKWGLKKKLSLEAIRKLFQDRGCEFLDDFYKGIHYNHRYRCKCGREAKISLAGFRNQNQYCKQCGLEKLRKENHPQWRKDRNQLRQDQLFRKKIYKMLSSTLKATNREKIGHTSDMIGYGPKELQQYIVNHPGWHRVKDADWHLDHIFPIQAFLDHGIKDVRLINSLDNLQPITQKENNEKGNKYNKKSFLEWLKAKNCIIE